MKEEQGQRTHQKSISPGFGWGTSGGTFLPRRKLLSWAPSSVEAGPMPAVLTDGCQDPCLSAQGPPLKLVTSQIQQGHLMGTLTRASPHCPPASNQVGPPAPPACVILCSGGHHSCPQVWASRGQAAPGSHAVSGPVPPPRRDRCSPPDSPRPLSQAPGPCQLTVSLSPRPCHLDKWLQCPWTSRPAPSAE